MPQVELCPIIHKLRLAALDERPFGGRGIGGLVASGLARSATSALAGAGLNEIEKFVPP
ncbi:uncharacterized protein EI90DRAFT_587736 [Cantharellus anzutake]|uniref:uncharacterized protein n=1 Tax=Cantharellus anzutake TaxID=1750568 RepID=UPI001905F68A|nr:uncharacterized protein EI90DRAFT_587736 [Cantharellus anzutake]KAF8333623.1 hypothetical protein EI90DRAFT_587736 [Cantharellus anzutake]